MFSAATLADSLAALGQRPDARFAVAYSGGLDSTVLLHALVELRARTGCRLHALHFNHRLHPDSSTWQQKCAAICSDWNIPFTPGRPPKPIAAREAAARQARYAWFARHLPDGYTLLTAHHADDQIETMLLGLFAGRARQQFPGMPAARQLTAAHPGRLLRPLLHVRRADLRDYAQACGLDWVEDPQNHELDHARNHLRHQVLPELLAYWPNLHRQLAASAAQLAAAEHCLHEQARRELARLSRPQGRRILCLAPPLSLLELLELPDTLSIACMREWLHSAGQGAPTEAQLQEWLRQLRHNPNGTAQLSLAAGALHQYRQRLYLSAAPVWHAAQPVAGVPEAAQPLPGGWQLRWQANNQPGLSQSCLQQAQLRLISRPPLSALRLADEPRRRPLKQLFQARGIPPWERTALPILEVDGQVAWLPGLGWVEGFAKHGGWSPQLRWLGG